jgi:hypothetical protein
MVCGTARWPDAGKTLAQTLVMLAFAGDGGDAGPRADNPCCARGIRIGGFERELGGVGSYIEHADLHLWKTAALARGTLIGYITNSKHELGRFRVQSGRPSKFEEPHCGGMPDLESPAESLEIS